jgi:tRNA(Ile)-lysidine synthase
MNKSGSQSLDAGFSEAWRRLAPKKLRAGALLAVSGGVDSMVLAHLVYGTKIRCAIAHVNFSLRGEASDADEAFVRGWAEEHGLKFHSVRFDTGAEAAQRGTGIQETARLLRYGWFEEIRRANDYSVVLTAHHADDNAETFLLNLFRGAGLTGLGGIPPQSGNVLRPLLGIRKSALIDFAGRKGVSFREDASNATQDYLRNAVRHMALPSLDILFPDAAGRLAETAVRLRESASIYESALNHRLKPLLHARGPDTYIPIRALLKAEPLATLLHEIFSPLGFSSAQLPQLLALTKTQSGRFVTSPMHRVIRHRQHLVITANTEAKAELFVVEEVPTLLNTGAFQFRFEKAEPPASFSDDPSMAWLDASELQGNLILRRARAGDYFYPLGMPRKKKKVTRFLTALKVARNEKEAVWVLECDGRIAWVAGYRIDERFKLSPGTKEAVRIQRTPVGTKR